MWKPLYWLLDHPETCAWHRAQDVKMPVVRPRRTASFGGAGEWAWQRIERRWWQLDRRVNDVCDCRDVCLGDDVVQVVQDRLLQSGVGLHRGDQDGEVAL